MSQINPFTASILQTPQVQRQQAAEKSDQVRRTQTLRKNSASFADVFFEHQVESAEELAPIHEDAQQHQSSSQQDPDDKEEPEDPTEEPPHLDVTG